MTGAAMAALCAAGVPDTSDDDRQGEAYLKADLVSSTGAFKSEFGDNTDSNAWAVQRAAKPAESNPREPDSRARRARRRSTS